MKTNAIIRIALYSFAIILLLSLLYWGFFGLTVSIGENLEHQLNGGISFDAERVSKIDIDWAAGKIILIGGGTRGGEDDIHLIPYGSEADNTITYEIDGDTLRIAYTNTTSGFQFGSIPEKTLSIYVPLNWICENLEIDGAALEIVGEKININSLDIDGAACMVNLQGSIGAVDCDGAACVLDLNCNSAPSTIDLDGVASELTLVIPQDYGFMVQLDGLSSTFHSTLPYTVAGRTYRYGEENCTILANGISCTVTVNHGK